MRLTIAVQYHRDLFVRLRIELFGDSRGSTLVLIVDQNIANIYRKL